MKFGKPQELPDGCVLLRPTQGADEFRELRRFILGRSTRAYCAHLTLLHPRNANGAIHDLAGISHDLADFVVSFSTVSLIEQYGDDPWQVKGSYGSAT